MNLPFKQVEPSVYSQTIQYFLIRNTVVVPFTSCSVSVDTFDVDKNFIYNRILTMTTQQYLEWQNNDDYLLNFVCSSLGLTLVPTTVNTEAIDEDYEIP